MPRDWFRAVAVPLLNLTYRTGGYRALGTVYAGCGVIFSLHRVVAPNYPSLHPAHLLHSDLLDDILGAVRGLGWDIVSIEEVRDRLMSGKSVNYLRNRRFVCFTLDDGYADTLTVALPIFRKYHAPICVYVTTGIVERSIFYWWGANQELILKSERVELPSLEGFGSTMLYGRTLQEKQAAYLALDSQCHRWGDRLIPVLRELYSRNGVNPRQCLDRDALSVPQLRHLATDPLVTVGSHCVTHQRLSLMADDELSYEVQEGRRKLEGWVGLEVSHLAYPFGLSDACGEREFETARQAGFQTAVTTRPGNVFPQHRDYLHCLPRRSIPMSGFALRNALFGVATILRNDSRVQLR